MQVAMQPTSPSTSLEDGRGLSDEEELRRIGSDLVGAEGLGEVLIDYGAESAGSGSTFLG